MIKKNKNVNIQFVVADAPEPDLRVQLVVVVALRVLQSEVARRKRRGHNVLEHRDANALPLHRRGDQQHPQVADLGRMMMVLHILTTGCRGIILQRKQT